MIIMMIFNMSTSYFHNILFHYFEGLFNPLEAGYFGESLCVVLRWVLILPYTKVKMTIPIMFDESV
jgi:hypothetical protein